MNFILNKLLMWFLRFKHDYLTVELELTQSYILQMFKHLLILIDFCHFYCLFVWEPIYFFFGSQIFSKALRKLAITGTCADHARGTKYIALSLSGAQKTRKWAFISGLAWLLLISS